MNALQWLVRIALVALLYRGCTHAEGAWYKSRLPDGLEVSGVLMNVGGGGLREGCGVIIFELGESGMRRLEKEGLPALPDRPWKPTPVAEEDRGSWMSGMSPGCAGLSEEMEDLLHRRMRSPGSFYTKGHEHGVVVIPELGWVVLSHFG